MKENDLLVVDPVDGQPDRLVGDEIGLDLYGSRAGPTRGEMAGKPGMADPVRYPLMLTVEPAALLMGISRTQELLLPVVKLHAYWAWAHAARANMQVREERAKFRNMGSPLRSVI